MLSGRTSKVLPSYIENFLSGNYLIEKTSIADLQWIIVVIIVIIIICIFVMLFCLASLMSESVYLIW